MSIYVTRMERESRLGTLDRGPYPLVISLNTTRVGTKNNASNHPLKYNLNLRQLQQKSQHIMIKNWWCMRGNMSSQFLTRCLY